MIQASCHCGNVKLNVNNLPSSITSCNCSICDRLGSLWAYYKPGEVTISFDKAPTIAYLWGDRELEFHHCVICGCTTHYVTTDKCDVEKTAVNARMMKQESILALPIRYFDGAKMQMKGNQDD
ncbi:MAG: hypothetical protein ACI9SC_001958 [Gammaproteobacteria bacterium]|jgi:hypothetical protein